MPWQFRNDLPIYTQLIAQIQQRIVSGALLPGERLPSVRDLAAEAGVNPNTMQRAMMEMEREELVHSQRTAGRFVTEDGERIRRLRESLARDYILDTIIRNYNPEAAVVISTHLIADIEKVLDEVIFIDRGQILFQSSVDSIREEKGMSVDALFREVYRC